MSDDEVMAAARRGEVRRMIGKMLFILGLVAIGAGATQFLPGDPADAGSARWMIFAAVAAVCLLAGVTLIVTGRVPPEARDGRVGMLRAERLQRRRQVAFILMPLSLVMQLSGVIRATDEIFAGAPVRHLDLFILGAFVVFVLLFGLLLGGWGLDRWARPVLDDELSRELRGRALQFGYFMLMPGLTALFIVGLFHPNLAIELTPILAVIGVGGPALRLFWLERSAGAGLAEA